MHLADGLPGRCRLACSRAMSKSNILSDCLDVDKDRVNIVVVQVFAPCSPLRIEFHGALEHVTS